MNWAKIKYFFLDAFVWIVAHWQIAALVAAFVALLLIVGWIQSCNANRGEKKLEKQRQEITNKEVNAAVSETLANVQENKVKEKEIIANEKANISNRAAANYNAVVNRDSGEFDTDFERTKRAYCADRPNDSLCQSVR